MKLRYCTVITVDQKYKEIPEMYTCLRGLYVKTEKTLEYYDEVTGQWKEPDPTEYKLVET